jgi:hypothetical protein
VVPAVLLAVTHRPASMPIADGGNTLTVRPNGHASEFVISGRGTQSLHPTLICRYSSALCTLPLWLLACVVRLAHGWLLPLVPGMLAHACRQAKLSRALG